MVNSLLKLFFTIFKVFFYTSIKSSIACIYLNSKILQIVRNQDDVWNKIIKNILCLSCIWDACF